MDHEIPFHHNNTRASVGPFRQMRSGPKKRPIGIKRARKITLQKFYTRLECTGHWRPR